MLNRWGFLLPEKILGFQCKGGRVIVDSVHTVPELLVVPVSDRSLSAANETRFILEEAGFVPVLTFNGSNSPMYPQYGCISRVQLESEEPQDIITLDIYSDAKLVPFKQSFWTVFQSTYRYRFNAAVKIDFLKKGEPQKGTLERACDRTRAT